MPSRESLQEDFGLNSPGKHRQGVLLANIAACPRIACQRCPQLHLRILELMIFCVGRIVWGRVRDDSVIGGW